MSKRIPLIVAGVAVTGILAACSSPGTPSGIAREAASATAGWNQIIANQPPPVFASSQIRKEVTEVESVQALGSPTTSFFMPEGWTQGSAAAPIKSCPSQGESIPGGTQLTNPYQIIADPNGGTGNAPGSLLLPQGDPNGIYPPVSAAQTYVVCLDAAGNPRPSSWEGPVEVEVGAAKWVPGAGIVDYGPNMLPTCTVKTAVSGDGSGVKAGTKYTHCVPASTKGYHPAPVTK